jgi:hypothetical protein
MMNDATQLSTPKTLLVSGLDSARIVDTVRADAAWENALGGPEAVMIATTDPTALEDAHGWVLTPCSDEDEAELPDHFWVNACVNESGERVSRKRWDAVDGTVPATEAEVRAALATAV